MFERRLLCCENHQTMFDYLAVDGRGNEAPQAEVLLNAGHVGLRSAQLCLGIPRVKN
jgi:hypothetical protein